MALQKRILLAALALPLVMAGCSGGSGSTSQSTPPTATSNVNTGQAVDGYLNGAVAFYDANGNGQLDAGEPNVATDAQGRYSLTTPGGQKPITIINGSSTDTGLAFKGLLKAPVGSAFATPLTTLLQMSVESGQSLDFIKAELQKKLGLSQDVTKSDPMKDLALQSATLSVQQIVQQCADTMATLSANTTTDTKAKLYALTAKAMIASLQGASSSISFKDTTSTSSLVNTVVSSTLNSVAQSTTLPDSVKASLAALKPASVAAFAAPQIADQVRTLSNATNVTDLTNLAKTEQSSPTLANLAAKINTLLSNNSSVSTTDLTNIANAVVSNTAAQTIADMINNAAGSNIISGPTVSSCDQLSNYFAIQNDAINFNGSSYTLAGFESGSITVSNTFNTLSFGLVVNGNPIPANTPTTVSVGVEVKGLNDSRVIQAVIDKVVLTLDASNNLTVSVPSTAKMYVYGKDASGNEANVVLVNVDPNVLTSSNGQITFNNGASLKAAQAALGGSNPVFGSLQQVKGNFAATMAISKVDVARKDASGNMVLANSYCVTVSGMSQSVSGYGASGKVSIQ